MRDLFESSHTSTTRNHPSVVDRSIPALLRQLAEDGRALVQQEIDLAKLEIRTSVTGIGKNAALIAGGLPLLALGGIVLIVFLILALGRLLGGEYWLSTLIVGGAATLAGLLLLLAGRRGMQRAELRPSSTVASLRENREWASGEIRDVKRELAR